MFVLGNFLLALAQILQFILYAYIFILIVDSILSFLGNNYQLYQIKQVVSRLAGLMLNPLRKVFKPIGNVDYTPFIAILILVFVNSFVVQTLFDIGARLR
ncbi:MAG TPA: YggT family protein [Thermotogota bacterium]|jgi:YggT family protein|nr:YggT family protein [Thermotogota bacterium]HNR63775.1 YggT family protein [Thermotogota bacterium]HNT95594.1 YggT family protein [Thermotogota bacterium]HOZ11904.1 YggT family protein [Thermotogota bacterium]HPB86922.1 YggT family protein [Thermotogota bacterium]